MMMRSWAWRAMLAGVLMTPLADARAQVDLPLPTFGQPRQPSRPATPPPATVQPARPPAATTATPARPPTAGAPQPARPGAPPATAATPGADGAAPPPAAGPPPYQTQLERLAELLGSLHYLRALCQADEGQTWRAKMSDLIAAENPAADDRKRMVEAFNRGYLSLSEVHRQCTPVAVEMVDRAMAEAAKTARDIATRFGR